MKRKSVSIFWGIMFVLGGCVTFFLYGMHAGQVVLLIIGAFLLFPFKSKTEKSEENNSSLSKEKNVQSVEIATTPLKEEIKQPEKGTISEVQTPRVNPAFFRDVKSNSFYVAGVTFSNESGKIRSRQTILRRILFNDPPFDCDHIVTLEKYIYENEPAFYVKVNDYIIGNVPKEFIPYVDFNFDRPYKIVDFQVYGGQNGKKFGASLKMVFLDTLEA